MPEGPEVLRMADQLREFAQGKQLHNVQVVGGRFVKKLPEGLGSLPSGLLVHNVQAKGKFLYWTLDDSWSIWCTMGMSGGWRKLLHCDIVDRLHIPQEKHDALKFQLRTQTGDGGSISEYVFFNDSRRFGTVKFVKGKTLLDDKLRTLGFDFLDREQSVTAIWWFLRDCRKGLLTKEVGDVLLDQSVFAGVGNYLRAEVLYAARVSPWRKLKDVTYEEFQRICEAIRATMLNSYSSNGATIATYHDINGNSGSFASKFAVYGRQLDPNGNEVKREQMPDGRTIWWVPSLQT